MTEEEKILAGSAKHEKALYEQESETQDNYFKDAPVIPLDTRKELYLQCKP